MERCNFLLREAPGRGRKLTAHLEIRATVVQGKKPRRRKKIFTMASIAGGKSRSDYCEGPVTCAYSQLDHGRTSQKATSQLSPQTPSLAGLGYHRLTPVTFLLPFLTQPGSSSEKLADPRSTVTRARRAK
jgi:hypothetical protein